jgi:hypothetical protein
MSNDSKPDAGATVMMTMQPQVKDESSSLPVLGRHKSSKRVIFPVSLAEDGQWETTDVNSGDRRRFADQREALLHARVLARAHWSANKVPCGVSLEKDGLSHMAALYGAEPPE